MYMICGVDEAGRGPLAGPVAAAAVILPHNFPIHRLNDSKKLTHEKRLSLSFLIFSSSIDYSIGWASSGEIDRLNIHHAVLLAMNRALESLRVKPHLTLIDGLFAPSVGVPVKTIVKGDTYVPQIQAASIIAKTVRDMWMIRYSWIEQRYHFERHKGYATRLHRECCFANGLSPIHRKTFSIKDID